MLPFIRAGGDFWGLSGDNLLNPTENVHLWGNSNQEGIQFSSPGYPMDIPWIMKDFLPTQGDVDSYHWPSCSCWTPMSAYAAMERVLRSPYGFAWNTSTIWIDLVLLLEYQISNSATLLFESRLNQHHLNGHLKGHLPKDVQLKSCWEKSWSGPRIPCDTLQ